MSRHNITEDEIKTVLTGNCPICGGKMTKPEKDMESKTLFYTCFPCLRMFKITKGGTNFSIDIYPPIEYGVK
jgi:hypothetical protein